jgi:undecaprenyl pyrophosphate phosphatase UppP
MWPIVGILLITGCIIAFEFPRLIKQKMYKELCIFSLLIAFGFILSILESFNVELPNPLDALTFIYKPISTFIFGLFE